MRQRPGESPSSNGERRLVFGVDIDGVLADYESGLRDEVAAYTGTDPADIPRATSWNFHESGWPIRDQEHFLEIHRWAVAERGLFVRLPVIEGASDALWKLSDAGVHIRIITHRLITHGDHAQVMADTARWLSFARPDGRPRFPTRTVAFADHKDEVAADVYVDDAEKNVARLRERRPDAVTFVFDQPYNQDVAGPRVSDWPTLAREVLAVGVDRGLLPAEVLAEARG